MTTIVYDKCDETSSTNLASHLPNIGSTWVNGVYGGNTNPWNVGAGTGNATATAGDALYYNQAIFPSADYWVQLSFIRSGFGGIQPFVVFRYQDINNYYRLGLNEYGSYLQLVRRASGSDTTLATWSWSPGDGTYKIRAEISGSTITGYVDGTQRINYTDGTPITSAGKMGLMGQGTITYICAGSFNGVKTRVDDADLITSKTLVSHYDGFGILGLDVPSTGVNGPAFIYDSLSLPDDDLNEYRAEITSLPTLTTGTLSIGESSAFSLVGAAEGEYEIAFDLYEYDSLIGSALVTILLGDITLANVKPLIYRNGRISVMNTSTETIDPDCLPPAGGGGSGGIHARVASTGNVTISSPGATIDGVTLATGELVLLKDQTTASQNGVYTFDTSSTPMVRNADLSSSAEAVTGLFVTVSEGTVNATSVWMLTTAQPITLDTTSLTFRMISRNGITGTVYATASATLAAGDWVNLHDNTGTMSVRKADASNGRQADGFVRQGYSSGNSVLVWQVGINDKCSGLTQGSVAYLSASTPGLTTHTMPSAGNLAQKLGIALSTTEVLFTNEFVIQT